MSQRHSCTITGDEQSLVIEWSYREGGWFISLLAGLCLPIVGVLLWPVVFVSGVGSEAQTGSFLACVVIPIMIGVLGAGAAWGSSVEIRIDRTGVVRKAFYALGYRTTRSAGMPLAIRSMPLRGSADHATTNADEWLVVIHHHQEGTIATLSVDRASHDALQDAMSGLRLEGLTFLKSHEVFPPEMTCNSCGYDFDGLTGLICPECGKPLNADQQSVVVAAATGPALRVPPHTLPP